MLSGRLDSGGAVLYLYVIYLVLSLCCPSLILFFAVKLFLRLYFLPSLLPSKLDIFIQHRVLLCYSPYHSCNGLLVQYLFQVWIHVIIVCCRISDTWNTVSHLITSHTSFTYMPGMALLPCNLVVDKVDMILPSSWGFPSSYKIGYKKENKQYK